MAGYGESGINETIGNAVNRVSPIVAKSATKSATLDMIAEINMELNDLRGTVASLRNILQHVTLNTPQLASEKDNRAEKHVPPTVIHGELKGIIDVIRSIHRDLFDIKSTVVV